MKTGTEYRSEEKDFSKARSRADSSPRELSNNDGGAHFKSTLFISPSLATMSPLLLSSSYNYTHTQIRTHTTHTYTRTHIRVGSPLLALSLLTGELYRLLSLSLSHTHTHTHIYTHTHAFAFSPMVFSLSASEYWLHLPTKQWRRTFQRQIKYYKNSAELFCLLPKYAREHLY